MHPPRPDQLQPSVRTRGRVYAGVCSGAGDLQRERRPRILESLSVFLVRQRLCLIFCGFPQVRSGFRVSVSLGFLGVQSLRSSQPFLSPVGSVLHCKKKRKSNEFYRTYHTYHIIYHTISKFLSCVSYLIHLPQPTYMSSTPDPLSHRSI